MAISASEREMVKAYMHISDMAGDDDVIDLMYEAARAYAKNAGITEPANPEDDPQWRLIICGLTLHYYYHRDSGGSAEFPPGLRRAINQRKLTDGAV